MSDELANLSKQLQKNGELRLSLRIQPGCSKQEWVGYGPDHKSYRVKLRAPPTEGAANRELIEFLAQVFSVAKSYISVTRGQLSKYKLVTIQLPKSKATKTR